MLWQAFREINRASSMAQRSIILPPGAPRAHRDALRTAVTRLKTDKAFQADAQKSVNFVPDFTVGAAAEKIVAASTKLSPEVLKFLDGYLKKVTTKKSN